MSTSTEPVSDSEQVVLPPPPPKKPDDDPPMNPNPYMGGGGTPT